MNSLSRLFGIDEVSKPDNIEIFEAFETKSQFSKYLFSRNREFKPLGL